MNKLIIALVFVLSMLSIESYSQCKYFANTKCRPELKPYIHDGNYHGDILSENEEAELYKTFYSDIDYRLFICADDAVNKIEIKIYDSAKQLLYSNEKDYSPVWDFKLESAQQLKISIKILPGEKPSKEPKSGCVAILIGMKDN